MVAEKTLWRCVAIIIWTASRTRSGMHWRYCDNGDAENAGNANDRHVAVGRRCIARKEIVGTKVHLMTMQDMTVYV